MMIDTAKFASTSYVAELIGEPRPTLVSAIETGAVESVSFRCGSVMVSISSARQWAKSDRKRGRPPKPVDPHAIDGQDSTPKKRRAKRKPS